MLETTMSDHVWVNENLDAYLAGGLSAEERHDIERHCADCTECAHKLADSRKVEQLMDKLFAATRPDAGLEDRAILALQKPKRRYGVLQFILAAAAVIVLGVIGFVAQAIADHRAGRQIVLIDDSRSMVDPDVFAKRSRRETDIVAGKMLVGLEKESSFDTDINYMVDRIAEVSVPGTVNHRFKFQLKPDDAIGIITGGDKQAAPPVNLPAPGGFGDKGQGGALEGFMPKGLPLTGSYYGRSSSTNSGIGDKEKRIQTIRPNGEFPKPGDYNPPGIKGSGDKAPGRDKDKDAYFDIAKSSKITEAGYDNIPFGFKGNDPKDKLKPPGDPKQGEPKPGESSKNNDAKQDKDKDELQSEPDPNPGRKIIRTGEMEFEVEGYDAAVVKIAKLIDSVKGGFIATRNSDKLANGKVKGSIVVRMPPQSLDKFLLDVRAIGELKGERIGSLDVTKQYTDTESELRAARAVETRLIEIIKTGKGEIKDLIAAERELGTWRTKIEKMEGEIRYYNNQVSLSTITIHLYEKEILAAFALVMRERVTMNIEVEEVEKAQDSVLAGVKAAKGRILKSDLNVGDAGQVSAQMVAEISPDAAPLFRELLKKLGTVARHVAERTQSAEGGTAKAQDIKSRTDDVRFELTLYNTANIKPRETFQYSLGTSDVADSYQKLKAAVEKLKGQVRHANLDEKDKLNVHATFNFNVGAGDRAAIDKLVADAGFVVTKHTVQAGINETATDRKVGYELTILNTLNLKPRETFNLKLAAQDVTASYRKLKDAVEAAKGQIRRANLDEKDRLDVIADIAFHVNAADRVAIDKVIADAGIIINRHTIQANLNEISTERTVGYDLTLRNIAAIPPRDAYHLQVASLDVAAGYRRLHEAVTQLKGRIEFGQLNEQDKFKVEALIRFNVNAADKPAIEKLIGETGVVVSRKNEQSPSKEDSTDQKLGYEVHYRSVAGATPREKANIGVSTDDVDQKANEMKEAVAAAKGRLMNSVTKREKFEHASATLIFEVPHASFETLVRQFKTMGALTDFHKEMNPQVPDNELATGQIAVVLRTPTRDVPAGAGLLGSMSEGLYLAFFLFSICLQWIIIGLAIILPWALVLWAGWRLFKWMSSAPEKPLAVKPVALVAEEPKKP
jgi:hypothetical protein